jgi:hypothetical protein
MIKFLNLLGKPKLEETYLVDCFLTIETCNKIVDKLNEINFDRARQFDQGRHNKELFTDDISITDLIKVEIEKLRIGKRDIKAYSFPFEFYRYDKEDFIDPHTDSSVALSNGNVSNYTALIYLNDDYFGGETFFIEKKMKVKPKRGKLLLFQHHLVHEAQKIVFGTKYIYRSNWHIG